MQTLKKKDLKNYKPSKINPKVDELEETEEIDELVNNLGGEISGDEKAVSNSEIHTAPQATTDDFNTAAIQPNRYLFNVNSVGPRVNGINSESANKKAKDKMFELLESIFDNDNQKGSPEEYLDINNNHVVDVKELPANVGSKLKVLVNSIANNRLDSNQITIILNTILSSVAGQIDQNDLEMIKNKL